MSVEDQVVLQKPYSQMDSDERLQYENEKRDELFWNIERFNADLLGRLSNWEIIKRENWKEHNSIRLSNGFLIQDTYLWDTKDFKFVAILNLKTWHHYSTKLVSKKTDWLWFSWEVSDNPVTANQFLKSVLEWVKGKQDMAWAEENRTELAWENEMQDRMANDLQLSLFD